MSNKMTKTENAKEDERNKLRDPRPNEQTAEKIQAGKLGQTQGSFPDTNDLNFQVTWAGKPGSQPLPS